MLRRLSDRTGCVIALLCLLLFQARPEEIRRLEFTLMGEGQSDHCLHYHFHLTILISMVDFIFLLSLGYEFSMIPVHRSLQYS